MKWIGCICKRKLLSATINKTNLSICIFKFAIYKLISYICTFLITKRNS